MSAPIAFLDTETTHLDYDLGRPWEIAIIRRDPDDEESTLHIMVTDVDITDADPEALEIGRFYDRHPIHRTGLGVLIDHPSRKDSQDLPEYVAARSVVWATRDACLVGANVQYDMHMLRTMLKRHGLLPRWHYRPVDITGYAAGYLNGVWASGTVVNGAEFDPDLPWSGARISEALGQVQNQATLHTAMGDALHVRDLWDRLLIGEV